MTIRSSTSWRACWAAIAMLWWSETAAQQEFFRLFGSMILESGDAWSMSGRRFRLYGVQSCLRGTVYTDLQNRRRDCGDASLAVFSAFIKDTGPSCAPIVKSADVTYVVCYATVAGKKIDLGTAMISEGYAFASLDRQGLPLNPAYAVAEQEARSRKAGLWQFPDIQHPALVMGKALRFNRGDTK